MTNKVYSYVRFSTIDQKNGHSLTRQTDYARKYADDHGLVLDDQLTMLDEGLSAYHQAHVKTGALGQFLNAVRAGLVEQGSVLIVENLDRLSRARPIDALQQFIDIIRAGITLVTANNGRSFCRTMIDQQPTLLFESLTEMIRANSESAYKSQRVTDALQAQINSWMTQGTGKLISSGREPLWLRRNADKTGYEFVEGRDDIIRLIVDKFMLGWGAVKTCHYLNGRFPPFSEKQKAWSTSYVGALMRNPALCGKKVIKLRGQEYVIPDYYPAIMTETDFDVLQLAISRRASTKGQSPIPSLLTGMGILHCGHCGEPVISHNSKPGFYKGRQYKPTPSLRRLRCSSETSNNGCLVTSNRDKDFPRSLQSDVIERAVLEYCSDHIELSGILNSDTDQTLELKARLSTLQGEAEKSEKGISEQEAQLQDFIESGGNLVELTNALNRARQALDLKRSEIDKLEKELAYLHRHTPTDLLAEWEAVKGMAHSMDENSRLLVRQIVKRTFNRITLYFHSFRKSDTGELLNLNIDDNLVVISLLFNNDKRRLLVIDKKTGSWVNQKDFQSSCPAIAGRLVDAQAEQRQESC